MNTLERRAFLRQTSVLTAGTLVWQAAPSVQAAGVNEKVVLGIIGPGGMGMNHLRALANQPDVTVAYVCDPDEARRSRAARETEKLYGKAPKAVEDMREVFGDHTVDAVFIATPDHWHTPAAILALEAGKHVYVEKPCSHNIREGRLLVDAARRAGKVVLVGTQSRSTAHVRRAMELLAGGAIGEVLVAKAWNSQLRANIGHATPATPPPSLNFDLWLGPAPKVPYQPNLLPSSWRWFAAFGAGDAGNDGVHEIDIARWGLGVNAHPDTILGLGGKYFFDDDQQFPDTQYAAFEYGRGQHRKQLIYEQRIWSPYVQEGHENGNAFYGTNGMLILGKHAGWQLYGPRNKLVDQMAAKLDLPAHHRHFLDCLKHAQAPHANAETGHLSASLSHLANIVTRLGRTLKFDPEKEQFIGDDEAQRLVRRAYREGHWAVPKGV